MEAWVGENPDSGWIHSGEGVILRRTLHPTRLVDPPPHEKFVNRNVNSVLDSGRVHSPKNR